MSLLLLFAGAEAGGPPPPTGMVPQRTLTGVGITLALLATPLMALFL